MSTSKAHAIFMEQQTKKYPDKQPLRLQRLSDTCWTTNDELKQELYFPVFDAF